MRKKPNHWWIYIGFLLTACIALPAAGAQTSAAIQPHHNTPKNARITVTSTGAIVVRLDGHKGASGSAVYASKPIAGTDYLAARVVSLRGGVGASAGILARWGKSDDSPSGTLFVSSDGWVTLVGRRTPGGKTTRQRVFTGLPVDLRLTLVDGMGNGFYRAVGGKWTMIGTVPVPRLNEFYRLGLVVVNQSPGLGATAVFKLGLLPPVTAVAPALACR